MKYPIGIQTFEKIIKEGYVYIDKTDLVYSLAKGGEIYFLSRPRRFGKSLLLSTLKAYFEGKKELFAGLKIDALEKDWHLHKVFHIDFNGENFTLPGTLENCLTTYITNWEKEYDIHPIESESVGSRFEKILKVASEKTGQGAVVLIDEYDKPLLDVLEKDPELLDRNRETLKAFYSVFKRTDAYLRFVFLTGVTKFSQVSVFSGFNQPKDISMYEKYEALCGITEEELLSYFEEPIREMAQSDGCSEQEMQMLLKQRYDGYHFGKNMTDVYNPFSLLNAFDSKDIRDFWFASGTPTYLIRLMNHFNEGIDQLTGRYYTLDEFVNYKADIEYPLPMIYQSGYLTIKEYDKDMGLFLLDFPNNEVKGGFLTMLTSNYLQTKVPVESWIRQAVFALKQGKLEEFMKMLTSFLAGIPYSMRRKEDERERERYFQYTFYLILRLMSVYTVSVEREQSEGRVDCIVETPKFVYIFEFKLDGSAEEAIKQIEDKGYARPYECDSRTICKIGVNFSSVSGTIDTWKVL